MNKKTIIKCINTEDNKCVEFPAHFIKNIIACKKKDGTPMMMVNYYDDEMCLNSTLFCDIINTFVIDNNN